MCNNGAKIGLFRVYYVALTHARDGDMQKCTELELFHDL